MVVRLTVFELSVPISDLWQPERAFDMHLCYVAVFIIKIILKQTGSQYEFLSEHVFQTKLSFLFDSFP